MTMIFTIGHGNRAIGEFVALLREAGIESVVDARAYPISRRHPQFAREALDHSLADAGIRYVWEGKALGGRRKLEKSSPHVALKNAGFRAYAGYMETQAFRQGLDRLVEAGRGQRSAVMCAERLPWQCHRNLVGDSLVARGVRVLHLVGPGQSMEHTLSRLARIDGDRLVYDAGGQLSLEA
jgi:uncharacterized protein (DUF488 family)